MGCHSLLQGILLTQRSTQISHTADRFLYHLSHQGSPQTLINLFWASLGLCCSPGSSLVVEHGLAASRLSSCVSCALSCSVACGIFLHEGSNPCLLQWQVDSDPLYHQGSPQATIFKESSLLWTVADGCHDCALSRSTRDPDTRSRELPEASTLPSDPLCPVLGSRQDPPSFSFQRLH